MRELSVVEQRYRAVLKVISDGRTVTGTAAAVGVSRQTLPAWLGKYEAGGLDGLVDGSHRPRSSPGQMSAVVEAAVLEARRRHPSWGPRRIVVELARREIQTSRSGVYQCLVRAGLVEPDGRRRRKRDWKRWERGEAMELWQMDLVGGFLLADGSRAKALTGIDDHSRFCEAPQVLSGLLDQLRDAAPSHHRTPAHDPGQRPGASEAVTAHLVSFSSRESAVAEY